MLGLLFSRRLGAAGLLAVLAGCAAPAVAPPEVPRAASSQSAASPPPAPVPLPPAPSTSPSAALAPSTASATGTAPPAIRGERGDLKLFTLDGKQVRLADVGARVTVISIWGSFCVPCIRELPYIEALYRSEKDNPDVAVLTLVVDDHRDPEKHRAIADIASRLSLSVPVLFDEDIRAYKRLNGEDTPGGKAHAGITVPQVVVIDPGFTIRRSFGFKPLQPIEDFVREQRALIDLASRGQLPPEDSPKSTTPPPAGAQLEHDPGAGELPCPEEGDRLCMSVAY